MPKLIEIRKKDGSVASFEIAKLVKSIENALESAKIKDSRKKAKKTAQLVVQTIEKHFPKNVVPTIKDLQDIIIQVLKKQKLEKAAKAFIEHKKQHKERLGFRTIYGVRDDIGLSNNAVLVLAKRYLLRNTEGNLIETPARMFRRAAKTTADIESRYGKSPKKLEEEFYNLLAKQEFLPNSPTLMNAGTALGQLSACFALPVEDDLRSIFNTLTNTMLIHQSGGGTGFSFTKLRPEGDIVKSTKGVASGPLSFMTVYDKATDVIKQGGKRRGANMGILNADHPDIFRFAQAKRKDSILANFNISAGATDKFIEAADKGKEWKLINPRTKKPEKEANAKELWEQIIQSAWECGDPGLVFLDEINRKNPTPAAGQIETTNPCGEVPLLPYESCNLGSIDVSKHTRNGKIYWEKLRKTVHLAVNFLDNIIDANKYPVEEVEKATKDNRKIGLGIMGFAECLARCGISYDSPKATAFAEKLMKFINDEAHKKSQQMAKERGSFPNFEKSIYAKKYKTLRNATLTTIAPTGTISIIANATSGIEPFFGIAYIREVMGGTKMLEVNPYFEEIAKKKGFYSKELMFKIAKQGSIQKITGIPRDVKKLFVTSFDIKPEQHVKMQAAFQKHTDNAVSKTVNLPEKASQKDIEKIFKLAHKLKCKGITVYRYGSKKEQVLSVGDIKPEQLVVSEEYAGGCITPECLL